MNSLTHASSVNVLLSSRGNCLGLRTTRAERSRSWLQVRPTGSELQALTALAGETSAQLASSRPASLVSLERPLLSKLPRWQIKDFQIADTASVFCPANTLTFITILFFFFLFHRSTTRSKSRGSPQPLHRAASWSIPCTWRWGRAARPPRSVRVRWLSSGSTAAQRCPAPSAPPTWTTPTSTTPPPTGQPSSSA